MDVLDTSDSKRKINPRSSGDGMTMAKKRRRSKKEKPIKVVHFTDPIRIVATADDFKRRVQELTGRSSTVADMLFVKPTEESCSEASTETELFSPQGPPSGCCSNTGKWEGLDLPLDLGLDDVGDCGFSDLWGLTLDDGPFASFAEAA